MANPGGMVAGFDVWYEPFEYLTRIADEGAVNLYVLVDFGAVDINVDLAGALGVRAQVAGDAVVKTHADGNEEVGLRMALLTQASPCMPIMPRFNGSLAGKQPIPRSVMATG